jgi:hypothetical protein
MIHDGYPVLQRFVGTALAEAENRQAILALQEEIGRLPQIECPPTNVFVPGIYARGITIPAGCVVVGKIHAHDHLSFGWGDVSVFSPAEGLQRFTGHWWTAAKAGIKRAVFTHAETFWCAVHPNPDDETDLGALERRYIARDFDELDDRVLEQKLREAMR